MHFARRRLPAAVALLVLHAHASCEPWCTSPCAELNGDPSVECGQCVGDLYRCKPPFEHDTLATLVHKLSLEESLEPLISGLIGEAMEALPKIASQIKFERITKSVQNPFDFGSTSVEIRFNIGQRVPNWSNID